VKIAIVSDIHSNLEALQACCRKAEALGVDRYICLGDIVGYCADPVATLDLVMSLPGIVAIRGNHDEAVLNRRYTPRASRSIQAAIEWTHDQLSPRHIAFINGLPYTYILDSAIFAHASVKRPEKWVYVYRTEQVRQCMAASEQPLIFLGHTHLPVMFYEDSEGVLQQLPLQEASPIPIYQRQRYLVNVGSVGQPRDGNSAASFVIYDTELAEVTFHRAVYDFTSTARKIMEADLHPRFAERLIDPVLKP